MKTEYTKPILEVVEFESEDVITTSGISEGTDLTTSDISDII